jgi:hypothetical protein
MDSFESCPIQAFPTGLRVFQPDVIGNFSRRQSCLRGLTVVLHKRRSFWTHWLIARLILKFEGTIPLRVHNPRVRHAGT